MFLMIIDQESNSFLRCSRRPVETLLSEYNISVSNILSKWDLDVSYNSWKGKYFIISYIDYIYQQQFKFLKICRCLGGKSRHFDSLVSTLLNWILLSILNRLRLLINCTSTVTSKSFHNTTDLNIYLTDIFLNLLTGSY